MGVDTHVRLPHGVAIREVAEVIGILAGLKPAKHALERSQGDKWFVSVDGAKAVGNVNIPEMATIELNAPKGSTLVDGLVSHRAFYHYESEQPKGARLLSVRATPFWIAMARRLVQHFGGEVVYSDCDDGKANYKCKCPRVPNYPTDGEPWQRYQEEVFNLKPITKAEIQKARKWAAYD